jgi:Domain of unknown function (DUF4326)
VSEPVIRPTTVHRGFGDVYIGRSHDAMHFGNHFSHKGGTLAVVRVDTLDEAVDRFDTWLDGTTDQNVEPDRRLWVLANIPRLKGQRLRCFCKPLRCHGDVLARRADTT